MNEKISQQFNQRHQQAVEKKLDRIIELLEEMKPQPQPAYDFLITGGEQTEKVTPSDAATCEGLEQHITPTNPKVDFPNQPSGYPND